MDTQTIDRAIAVDPIRYPDVPIWGGSSRPRVHHPQKGWGVVDVINQEGEIRLRFDDCFAWFRLDDPIFAIWNVEKAADLARWIERVTP